MARGPLKLEVEYTTQALADLNVVWDWNVEQRGVRHADDYLAFLKAGTLKVARSPNPGRPVPTAEIYRYALIRRRRKGYGHLAVFIVEGQTFRVLRYFHTSQDWQAILADKSPP